MSRVMLFVIALLSLATQGVTGAGLLQPFLEHAHGRAPENAWTALQGGLHAQTFVQSIANYNGWPETYVRDLLANNRYSTCSYQGWFWSDGLRFADGTWSVGTIYREAYPNERFACVQGRPIFSGTCGNAVRAVGGKPDIVCRDTGYEHGSITVGGAGAGVGSTFVGGTATTTTFESNLFECHHMAREK